MSPDKKTLRPESFYLRLSVTDGCNLGCTYCDCASAVAKNRMSAEGFRSTIEFLSKSLPISKVRFTGGEPLTNPDLFNIIKQVKGFLPWAECSLTTNGVLLASMAEKIKAAGLMRINISIDSVDQNIYRDITSGGEVQRVISGVKAAADAGFSPIKLNCVLLKNRNAEGMVDLIRFAATNGCMIRFIELMPVGQSEQLFKEEYLSATQALEMISGQLRVTGKLGLKSTSREYLVDVDGKEVNVGFISSVSMPFCSQCNRIRLDSEGTLFTCLRKDTGINIPQLLKGYSSRDAGDKLNEFIQAKSIPDTWLKRPMISIGG